MPDMTTEDHMSQDLLSRLWESAQRESQLRDRIAHLRAALAAVDGISSFGPLVRHVRRALEEDDRRAAT